MAACPQTESRTETISYTEFLTDPGRPPGCTPGVGKDPGLVSVRCTKSAGSCRSCGLKPLARCLRRRSTWVAGTPRLDQLGVSV